MARATRSCLPNLRLFIFSGNDSTLELEPIACTAERFVLARMASSLTDKGDSLPTSQAEPVSHTKPVSDTEKAEASKVTQQVIETGCLGFGNDTDSSAGLERWNGSRNNTARFLVVNLALFIMGMNDACLGVRAAILLFFIRHTINTSIGTASICMSQCQLVGSLL